MLVLAVIGVSGYYVWRSQKKTKADTTNGGTAVASSKPAQTVAAGPYAGWKIGTLTHEKITYYYPSDWTVDDQSISIPKSQDGCVYPGIDTVYLTSPSNEQVTLQTGIDCIGDASATAASSIPITVLGQSQYLVFNGYSACLSKTSDPADAFDGQSKNIFESSPSVDSFPVNAFCYYPYLFYTKAGGDDTAAVSPSDIQSSKDFAAAKRIFESMEY